MYYTIAICLIYMLAILITVIVQLSTASRKERLKQIKSFKRGKCALIYFAVVPLYFLAYRYNGAAVEAAIWNSVKSCIDIVVLKYDYATVAPLMAANLFYKITIETTFALIALNAFMFSISFCGQFLLNFFSLFVTSRLRKKVIVVVGNNPQSIEILKSIKKKQGKAVLMDQMSRELRDEAYLNRADCVNLSKEDDVGKKIYKLFRKFDKKQVFIIFNCEDDAVSLRYVKQLCKMIHEKQLTDLPLTRSCGLQAYVFAERANESSFAHYEEASCGLIKFVNRHEQIAMDFVENHPLTQYMSSQQIDEDSATIKKEVNLNVIMVGFGKLNETLFLTSVSNNQFLTKVDGKLQPKTVNYHIYDRNYPAGKIAKENTSIHSKGLNHGYMRYVKFLEENANAQADYLEFVPEPAKLQFHPCDVTHKEFYASLEATLKNPNAYSYVIVSLGTDIENLEIAEKLQQKFHEWNLPSFIKIFVKVRDKKLVKEIEKDFTGDLIEFFGTDCDTVYNAKKILNEDMTSMAKMRHLYYMAEALKKANKAITDEELERRAREKWYTKYKQFQRESNIFACLSIRMKLQLLGYDYARAGNDVSKEFLEKYENGDARTPSNLEVDGKRIWNYSNAEQDRDSIRHTFAVQEHQRWCANMICNGVIPSSIAEIKGESGGRILEKRQHGNLTTMEGLVRYRKIADPQSNASEEEKDVIRYDYQLMDDIVWLLHKCGYRLIKRG